eukprot:6466234-Amphidinium_carterae.1
MFTSSDMDEISKIAMCGIWLFMMMTVLLIPLMTRLLWSSKLGENSGGLGVLTSGVDLPLSSAFGVSKPCTTSSGTVLLVRLVVLIRWGMSKLKLLPRQAVSDLTSFLKCVAATVSGRHRCVRCCSCSYRMRVRGGRPIALLPQVYRLGSAPCRSDVFTWRQLCKERGETPLGHGALDETFDLAYLTEERTAAAQHHPGFSLTSKCYARAQICMLEEFALESGYPLYTLNVAFNMYSGNRRILVCAWRQVEVRKYVDDMVLISSGPNFTGNLCFAYRQVLAPLIVVNMRVNALKTVVLCNGSVTKRKLWKVWRTVRLPPVHITTRDLGVDTQWFAWRNPV